MVWIYLVESEECQSPLTNGSNQSHIAKSIPIVKECYYQDNPLGVLRLLRSGMIYSPSMQKMSDVELISYTEVSPAKTSLLSEMEKAWRVSEADYFSRSYAWPKKSSPSFYSLRMSVPLQGEVDLPLPKSLPRWGMIVDGVLYPLKDLWRRIEGKDGFYLPTPTASQAGKPIRKPSPSRKNKVHGYDIQDRIGEMDSESIGKKINVHLLEWMMGYRLKWTELEHWAIQFVHNKLEKRLKS